MWVSPLFLSSVSLAVFWLLDVLSYRQEDTCSVMTENPNQATIIARRMTPAALRFAQREVLIVVLHLWLMRDRQRYAQVSAPLFLPRLFSCLSPVVLLCIVTSSKAATYNTFTFHLWDPLFPLLLREKRSSPAYKWCFALLPFPSLNYTETWIRLTVNDQIYCALVPSKRLE